MKLNLKRRLRRPLLIGAAIALLLGIPLALLVTAGGGYLLARKSLDRRVIENEVRRELDAEPFRELFDDTPLVRSTDYPLVIARLEALLNAGPPVTPGGLPLIAMLRAPIHKLRERTP